MYHYFVSYLFQNSHGLAAGNCELTVAKPITSMQDVNDVTKYLRQQGLTDSIVMSFSRFDTAPATRQAS
jgi:hypothetical protein